MGSSRWKNQNNETRRSPRARNGRYETPNCSWSCYAPAELVARVLDAHAAMLRRLPPSPPPRPLPVAAGGGGGGGRATTPQPAEARRADSDRYVDDPEYAAVVDGWMARQDGDLEWV